MGSCTSKSKIKELESKLEESLKQIEYLKDDINYLKTKICDTNMRIRHLEKEEGYF